MNTAKLFIRRRSKKSKGFLRELRSGGEVPAVLHRFHMPSESIVVDKKEVEKVFSQHKGRVASVQFELIDEEGTSFTAIVKEIQHAFVDYVILHIDFCLLDPSRKVSVNVPIFLHGHEECVGLKKGGVLRQVIRKLRVRCLPENIPSQFELDISGLQMKKSLRLADLKIPEGVIPVADLKQLVVVVAKR